MFPECSLNVPWPQDPAFRVYTEKFANSQEDFFQQYAISHKKLSELGARFDPHTGFSIE
jgi:L-ascorbate peroxidase